MLSTLLEIECTATSIDAAVDLALCKFGCTRADVETAILQVPSSGFLGIFGCRPARVRVRLSDRGFVARRLCEHLLGLCGINACVEAHPASDRIELQIISDDSSLIIGRRGQTLDALQSLVVTMTDRHIEDRTPIIVDSDNYRARRTDSLRQLARRLSSQVRSSGRAATVQALPPEERRILHLALKEETGIESRSIGSGFEKKMLVSSCRG